MTPITRIEKYLAYITGEQVDIPSPVTRVEMYLAAICGLSVSLPNTPVTRVEMYLAQIAGQSVGTPDNPVTRAEMYLAAIAGRGNEVPVPVTRVEAYLAAWAEQSGGTITTATGLSPLTLANALAKPIHSLTQYGKCTQASAPTPSSPVDIKCNNGALKMVDDELPSGYKRLLGLTFNNNVYYPITGFKMRGSDTLRFSFKCSMPSPACNVLGAYDGASAQSNYSLYLGNSTSAKYLRYNGSAYRSDADSDTQYDVVVTPTGSTGMKSDSTWTEKTFESAGDLCIGTTSPTATSSKMVGDIIGNIVVDGRLKLIPCERVSDNVLGYYDTVGKTFYEPTGSGVVSMGYDGSHYELFVVGTPEALTVGEQTASVENLFKIAANNYYTDYTDEQNIISGIATRKVGVKVLNGTEDWGYSSPVHTVKISDAVTTELRKTPLLCTHYPIIDDGRSFNNTPNDTMFFTSGKALGIKDSNKTSEQMKAWLAEQYSAGTPVIVVYPLAEETTEQTIPQPMRTVEGNNIVSVVSEVGEVELNVRYMGAE